jgi:putative membrane protein
MNLKRSFTSILVLSVMVLASVTAIAQAPPASMGNQPTLPGKGVAGGDHNVPHSFADQAFVKVVLERALTEEQLGQLAQQKSESADVKQLGQKMVENQTAFDEQFKTLAKLLEISPPKAPSKKDSQLIARLSGLSGAQFDEEYLKAVAKDNRQETQDFQSESQKAEDPDLLRATQEDVPVIAKYSQVIDDAARAHNVVLDAKK